MSVVLIKDNLETANKFENLSKLINNDNDKQCKYCIINYFSYNNIWKLIIETNKNKDSFNTSSSYISKLDNFNYKYYDNQKFDELNRSLSDLSDFYLEEKEDISLYNSSEEENVIKEEEITYKSKTRLNHKKYDDGDFENEIENDFRDILKQLNIKKNWFINVNEWLKL